jgi:hypothetical protein
MIEQPFTHHRIASLALLNQCPELPHKTAGFLGNVCVAKVLSDRQREWLTKLLKKNGMPPLEIGGAHD